MKCALVLCIGMAVLPSASAFAAGINLFWNDCSPGPTATTNRSFACDTNVGNNDMVASFDPPDGLTQVNGSTLILDLQSASTLLPAWWQFKNAGTCRSTSLQAISVFPGSCLDPWQGQGSPGITAYLTSFGGYPSRARIGASISLGAGFTTPVTAGQEYYSLIIRINNAKTVGADLCGGCLDPVCIVLNEIKITQVAGTPGGSPVLTTPLDSNLVLWQGGAGLCSTPVVNRTWGQIKSLYR